MSTDTKVGEEKSIPDSSCQHGQCNDLGVDNKERGISQQLENTFCGLSCKDDVISALERFYNEITTLGIHLFYRDVLF